MKVDPLAPQPMTPAEVESLVERARAASSAELTEWADRAARYAMRHATTIAAAARKFGVHPHHAQRSWRRLFPSVSAVLSKRSGR